MTTVLPTRNAPATFDILEKSNETMEWLRSNIRVGYCDALDQDGKPLGPPWWADDAVTKSGKWGEVAPGILFPQAVPMEVARELLGTPLFAKGTVHVTYTDEDGNIQVAGDENAEGEPRVQPIVNVRTGQIFSYPKAGYQIHPYLETLSDYIRAIQHDENVSVASVGLLKQGGQAFLQAVLPETLVVEGYEYCPYLLGFTSVDMSRSTSFSTGIKGAVCDNTVRTALDEAFTALKFRHTSKLPGVQFARDKLGVRLAAVGEEAGKVISDLCKIDVSDADFALWLDEIQPKVKPNPKSSTGGPAYTNAEAKRAEYERLWKSDPKVAPWAGTGFGVLQADNTYRQWAGKVTGEGGRIEQNFRRLVRGDTGDADVAALVSLGKVLDRKLVVTG